MKTQVWRRKTGIINKQWSQDVDKVGNNFPSHVTVSNSYHAETEARSWMSASGHMMAQKTESRPSCRPPEWRWKDASPRKTAVFCFTISMMGDKTTDVQNCFLVFWTCYMFFKSAFVYIKSRPSYKGYWEIVR